MKNNVKTISLCLGLASLALGQTTTAPIYSASILAGVPSGNGLGDGGPSTLATVASPEGIAVDPNGNVYVADFFNSRIRRIDGTTGIITTLANTTSPCLYQSPTSNTSACLSNPIGLAFDQKGDLLVTQSGNSGMILRVTTVATGTGTSAVAAGTITELAGTNVSGTFGGDGVLFYNSVWNTPAGITTDANDNIYIADSSNNRLRMVKNVNNCIYTPGTLPSGAGLTAAQSNQLSNTCKVYTIAGNGNTITPQVGTACGTNPVLTCKPNGTDSVGDGASALAARLGTPWGVAVTPNGQTVYVAQEADQRIRAINMLTGTISTVIGNCSSSTSSSNNVSGGAPTIIPCPSGTYGSTSANGTTSSVSTLGDGKLAVNATVNAPRGISLDSVNNILYFADGGNNRIRSINLNTGIVNTIVGGGSTTGDNGTILNSGLLTSLSLSTPYDVRVVNGLVYWVEQGNNKVRVADPVADLVKTLTAVPKSTGSGGAATSAFLGFNFTLTSTASPRVAVDNAGNVYIVEASTNKIRVVNSSGVINEWAGTGAVASSSKTNGDTGPAVVGQLSSPQSVAFDSNGNGYIADTGINRIRKVTPAGIISTVVGRNKLTTCVSGKDNTGNPCTIGTFQVDKSSYIGDGGPPLQAILNAPQGVAVDSQNNLIIADTGNQAIRYVNFATNTISTIAGGVPAGIENGPTDGRSGLGSSGILDATDARYGLFNNPRGVAVDNSGNIYVSDYSNSEARIMVPNGNGGYGLFSYYGSGSGSGTTPNIPTGTGVPSVPARIRINSTNNVSVAVDAAGNQYYALANDGQVKVVTADQSRVYLVAGTTNASQVGGVQTGLNYTTGNVANVQVPDVTGVAVDAAGNVYTADRTGVVLKLTCTKNCLPIK